MDGGGRSSDGPSPGQVDRPDVELSQRGKKQAVADVPNSEPYPRTASYLSSCGPSRAARDFMHPEEEPPPADGGKPRLKGVLVPTWAAEISGGAVELWREGGRR